MGLGDSEAPVAIERLLVAIGEPYRSLYVLHVLYVLYVESQWHARPAGVWSRRNRPFRQQVRALQGHHPTVATYEREKECLFLTSLGTVSQRHILGPLGRAISKVRGNWNARSRGERH